MKLTLAGVLAYARQPTTIAGLSTLMGVVTGVASKQLDWTAAVPIAVVGVAMIAIPENKAAQADAKAEAIDLVNVVARGANVATLTPAAEDAVKLAEDLAKSNVVTSAAKA